jgi:hypothetical protein
MVNEVIQTPLNRVKSSRVNIVYLEFKKVYSTKQKSNLFIYLFLH